MGSLTTLLIYQNFYTSYLVSLSLNPYQQQELLNVATLVRPGVVTGVPTDTNYYRKPELPRVQTVTVVEQEEQGAKELCSELLHAARTFTEAEQKSWLAFNENPEISSSPGFAKALAPEEDACAHGSTIPRPAQAKALVGGGH